MSLLILLLQSMWLLSAKADAKEEAAWTFPFRIFDWGDFQPSKELESKKAHRAGAMSISLILLVMSTAYTAAMYGHVKWPWLFAYFFLSYIANGLIYSISFNIKYNDLIGQDKHYLGTTAESDVKLRELFGTNAGKKFATICIVGTLVIDAFLILINFI